MRTKALASASVALLVAGGLAAVTTATGSEGKDIARFDVMAPVVEPFTGAAHAVRGVPGGGLPWQLDRATGRLRSDGRLDIRVDGLVLARRAPVPPAAQGTNPIPQFRGAVNCLTPASPDTGATVFTDPAPASVTGDARISGRLDLPRPCIAPIVFVTAPTGAWFATTGR
jgi:hypothetical protein